MHFYSSYMGFELLWQNSLFNCKFLCVYSNKVYFSYRVPKMAILRVLKPWLRIDMVFRFFHGKELKKLNQFWGNFTDSRIEVSL